MSWAIDRIINFSDDKLWGQGHVHYGFHDSRGNRYFFHYSGNWIGRIAEDDEFLWTAGMGADVSSGFHMDSDFENPIFLTEQPDGRLLVSCAGNASVFEIDPGQRTVRSFLDGRALGMKDISSCVLDSAGHVWVSEITGCKIWCFDRQGRVLRTIGTDEAGFQPGTVPASEARFGWIYVMKMGPDGRIYILDSTNYAVRRLDLQADSVETIVGTGKPGHSGDGGDAVEATLGGAAGEEFDGPYGLCVDEEGDLLIADTYNHAIRHVDRVSGTIWTIAGHTDSVLHQRNDPSETDPLKLNIPKAAGLDYHAGRLFIPEDDGDLIVLRRSS